MREIESGVAINRSATVSAFSGCFSVCTFCGCGFVSAFGRIELTRRRIPDDWIEPVDDVQTTTGMLAAGYRSECWSDADETTDNREKRQNSQRHPHRRRRFVRNVRAVMAICMSVRGYVMGYIFVYWSNMLAGFVSRAIAC